MNRTKTFTILLLILFTVSSCGLLSNNLSKNIKPQNNDSPVEKWGWKEIENGLSYTMTHLDKKDILVIKIDPRLYSFSIYENKNQVNAKTIEQIHKNTSSLLTFNGGFFTEDFKPTGLLLTENTELRGISNADLVNGILAINQNGNIDFFYQKNGKKFPSDINPEKYSFAIQNGPALINQTGEILIDEDSGILSSRSALGLDKNNNLILIIIKQSLLNPDNAISLYKFAHMIKESGIFQELGVHSVLNLDGGSSTGLMMDEKYFPEMEKVQNVIIVKAKS